MELYDINKIAPLLISTTTSTATIKGTKTEIAQRIITFDIETTSVHIDKDTLEPYDYFNDPIRNDKSLCVKQRDKIIKKKLDNCYHLSFMYIWQACIEIEEDVYYTFYARTWAEFDNFISLLKQFDDCVWVIHVHNLGFEFEYIRNKYVWDEQFFTHKHAPIYVKTDNVIFRCTYKMFGMSLNSVSKQLNCANKKGSGKEFNYNLYRHSLTTLTPKEMEYCEYDVLTLAQALRIKLNGTRNKRGKLANIWNLPLTVTGEPRTAIKAEIDNEKKRKFLYEKIRPCLVTDYQDYLTIKCAMKGGYTHCNPRYYGQAVFAGVYDGEYPKIKSRDKTSFYPYVMLTKVFPYFLQAIDSEAILDEELVSDNKATIFTVKFKNLRLKEDGFPYHSVHKGFINGKTKDTEFSALYHDIETQGSNVIVDNGKLVYADEVIDIITDIDWRVYQDNYTWDDCEKYNAIQGYKERLPLPYLRCIMDWYIAKTIYKGNDEMLIIYQNAKGKVNAIYGMSCTDPCKITIYYLNGKWIDDSEEEEFDIEKYTEEILIKKCEDYLDYSLQKGCQLCNLYQWGCYITAYCRSILMEHNKFVGIWNILYNDTDSLYYIVHNAEEEKRIDEYFDWYNDVVIKRELRATMQYMNDEIERNRDWLKGKPEPIKSLDYFAPKSEDGVPHMIGRMDIEHEIKAFKSLGAKRYCYIYYDEKNDCDVILPTVAGEDKDYMRKYLLEEIGEKQFYSIEDMKHIMDRFTNDTYIGMFESGKQCVHYHEAMPDLKLELTDHNGLTSLVDMDTGVSFMNIPFSMKENNLKFTQMSLTDMLDEIDDFALKRES